MEVFYWKEVKDSEDIRRFVDIYQAGKSYKTNPKDIGLHKSIFTLPPELSSNKNHTNSRYLIVWEVTKKLKVFLAAVMFMSLPSAEH